VEGIDHLGEPVRLAVELDRGAEPIAGRLRRADGSTSEFIGWLELTQALEDAQRQEDAHPQDVR
jgi:hypothetical protein